MAFQISAHGSRAGVLKHVALARHDPEGSDQTQIEAVKVLIASEVGALPTEFNGVRVEASGNAAPGSRTLSVQVVGMKLHLD